MSFATLQVSPMYGYVIAASIVVPFVASTYMGGVVMEGRKKFNVPYPNLYATPGFHKEADAFNRIQRGHQCYFETAGAFMLASLVAGLQYPWASIISILVYNLGSVFFQIGYADTSLDVASARYKKGGGIKWLGFFGAIGTALAVCGSIAGVW